jgi:hypothetical protein
MTVSLKVVFRWNERQYNPPEWEAWYKSEPIAHSRSLPSLEEKFPNGTVHPEDLKKHTTRTL